jgi:magnesium chelatase subunit D
MNYPFAALVGQEQLKSALCLIALHPGIGGLLIRGEKGTAKSTAARALVDLLPPLQVAADCPFNCDPNQPWTECPHCCKQDPGQRRAIERPVPFIDLPIGATEDRVLGSLDFDRALREGRRHFQPGLLAAAHRGILYMDEANLLPAHLVDVLLDAAAMGVNTVQREGMAIAHPARFLLIGTMNPEEGELRPQLLDRFGLMVEVAGPREPEVRAEVVRRRLAFESDPVAFAASWENEQCALRRQIQDARQRLPHVHVAAPMFRLISSVCAAFEVDGLRADIVMHKAAQALAALDRREAVTECDVRRAAELALPHRQKRRPFDPPGLDKDRLDQWMSLPPMPENSAEAEHASDEAENNNGGPDGGKSQVFDAALPERLCGIEGEAMNHADKALRNAVHDAAQPERGRFVRAILDANPKDPALNATLRAAIGRGGFHQGRLHVQPEDLHRKELEERCAGRFLFVVDSSGSMAARKRMEAVKGTVLRLLQVHSQMRDQAGVITFRGLRAEVLLPFTSSAEQAEQALRALPTGGRTPLAHALLVAGEMIGKAAALLVLLSDGKANVALPGTEGDPWQQALQAAMALAEKKVAALVLDTEIGFVRTGRAVELAQALGAQSMPLDDFLAGDGVLRLRTFSQRASFLVQAPANKS